MATKSIYSIRAREESGISLKPRLIRGDRRSAIEGHFLDNFHIEKATIEEAVQLGAEGVEIEDCKE